MMPVSLKEWQKMFADIFGKKNRKDYSAADLLLHIEESASKIDEGLRKEKKTEFITPLSRLFSWFLAFATEIEIDIEKTVWDKYQGICPYCGAKENCFCIALDTKPAEWIRNTEDGIPASLDEWQKMFKRIYGHINKMMWTLQIWLHFHEELGEISEAFRLGQSESLKEEVADAFAWLIAFCNKLNINLGELTYQRYPGKCDRCKREKCECPKI